MLDSTQNQEFIKKWSKQLILTRAQEYYLFHLLSHIKHRFYLLIRDLDYESLREYGEEYARDFVDTEIKYSIMHELLLHEKYANPLLNSLQMLFISIVNLIIRYNLRLVVSVAKRKYTNKGISLEDLLDEGVIGLLITIGKFDYRLNCKFSTYSIHWIKQRMFRCLNEGLRPVKLPMHIVSALSKIQDDDLDLDETVQDNNLRRRLTFLPRKKISLDSDFETRDYDLPSLQDTLVDETIMSDYQDFKQKSNRLKLVRSITTLQPMEERILRLKYGINSRGIYGTPEIARMLGYGVEEIGRLETSLVRKLKQKCRRKTRKNR